MSKKYKRNLKLFEFVLYARHLYLKFEFPLILFTPNNFWSSRIISLSWTLSRPNTFDSWALGSKIIDNIWFVNQLYIIWQSDNWEGCLTFTSFLCATYCTAVGSNHCHVFLSQWIRLGILNIDLQLNGQYPGGCDSNPCFCKVLIEQTFTRSLSTWF